MYYSGWKWMSALMGHHVSPYFGEWVVSVRALCSVNSSSCFLVDVFGILGAERRCSLRCVVDFWESNNRQTFHKHFSLLFGAFFNAMVICSMFDFYFGKKTGKIPKPNNSFKLGRLQNKNKSCFDFLADYAVLSRITHYIFVYVSVKRIDF